MELINHVMNYNYEIILNEKEKIKIGNDITLLVCRFGTKTVHFGCKAPRNIKFLRQELELKKDIE